MLVNYYSLEFLGLKRELPVVSISPRYKVASVNLLGDVELVNKAAAAPPATDLANLSEIERRIFDLLSRDQLQIDVIIRSLSLPPPEVSVALTMLQLKGVIKDWGVGVFGV